MINEEKTFKEFGYYSTSLKPQSHKKVYAICDKCGKERILVYRSSERVCNSCCQIGKKFSKQHREKLSKKCNGKNNPMYGKKHSEDSKKQMSKNSMGMFGKDNPMYGKCHSEESKQKMKDARSIKFGKKSPNWQGGISFEPYCINFNNKIKEQVREEFNRKCFLCGVSENNCDRKLSVHHVDYDRTQGCNSDWKLIPVCLSCHAKTSGKHVRDYYEELISRLLYIRELIFEYENKIDYRSI